ncbi:hypothetical protein [Helicobacter rodentium]|uniref:hypothetical protein n=1 Tax=Helicobacter rodentium TaxID=59617 RepID=UPI0025A68B0F|nr:hypothetical protein [Helicobacter rodentium]
MRYFVEVVIYIIRRGDLLFCHCERAKQTKQSIILHKVIFTMESLKKCILIDCHDSTSGISQ